MFLHGFSHATASLICVVSANAIGFELVRILPFGQELLIHWVSPTARYFGWTFSEVQLVEGFTLVLLAFIWGVAFKLIHGVSASE